MNTTGSKFPTRRLLIVGLLALPLASLAGSRAEAGETKTVNVRVHVPHNSISGRLAYGYYKPPDGWRVLDAALAHAKWCQVVGVQNVEGQMVRVGFHAPPGSILNRRWGGFGCYAQLAVVLAR